MEIYFDEVVDIENDLFIITSATLDMKAKLGILKKYPAEQGINELINNELSTISNESINSSDELVFALEGIISKLIDGIKSAISKIVGWIKAFLKWLFNYISDAETSIESVNSSIDELAKTVKKDPKKEKEVLKIVISELKNVPVNLREPLSKYYKKTNYYNIWMSFFVCKAKVENTLTTTFVNDINAQIKPWTSNINSVLNGSDFNQIFRKDITSYKLADMEKKIDLSKLADFVNQFSLYTQLGYPKIDKNIKKKNFDKIYKSMKNTKQAAVKYDKVDGHVLAFIQKPKTSIKTIEDLVSSLADVQTYTKSDASYLSSLKKAENNLNQLLADLSKLVNKLQKQNHKASSIFISMITTLISYVNFYLKLLTEIINIMRYVRSEIYNKQILKKFNAKLKSATKKVYGTT